MSKSDAERLDDLEILAAHQSRLIDELNDVIIEQGRIISDLRRRMEATTSRMQELEDNLGPDVPVDRPPHW